MLLAEYDYTTDIAVQREEEREIALEEGEAIGFDRGRKDGLTEGLHQGVRQNKLETARLMRLENLGIGLISKVTGLSEAEIENL